VKKGEEYYDVAFGDKKTEIQDVSYDHSLEQASMMVGTPMISIDRGEVFGVLAGRINVGEISKIMMERSGLGSTGESVIVSESNLVMTDLLKEPGSVMKKTLFSPQIKQCLLGKTVAGEVTDYHGDTVYGHYVWSDGLRSCIATKVD
jgi:methyl-accepting chemotaxis protein